MLKFLVFLCVVVAVNGSGVCPCESLQLCQPIQGERDNEVLDKYWVKH